LAKRVPDAGLFVGDFALKKREVRLNFFLRHRTAKGTRNQKATALSLSCNRGGYASFLAESDGFTVVVSGRGPVTIAAVTRLKSATEGWLQPKGAANG